VNDHIKILRALIASERGIILPGASNAVTVRVVADLGFKAVYLTGAGLTNMFLGLPNLGFMDLTQLVEHTMAIRNVIELPLVVDADTGFGNALHASLTVRLLERAGASAIQLEDQRTPKRWDISLVRILFPSFAASPSNTSHTILESLDRVSLV
jgi:2-methylisocitrate lyase-like PEP mutase family enzyme